ncbi:hypothetical protein ATCC90586_000503 [Pythium insidiosum]|nr:hypothetical protein ATCC90586_000503 [Pythium insidiosum]
MDRFFLEHHVMYDREPDELQRHDSDSDATDEEEQATERVHSVRDPTGPWTQTPVDGPWGQARRRVGERGRQFLSTHTGPKGVLKDYKDHKRQLQLDRQRQERDRENTLLRIAHGVTALDGVSAELAHNPACKGCEPDDDDDDDDDDEMLLNDAFLQQYNAMRLQELQQDAVKRRTRFGRLELISPDDYVELTSTNAADVVMVVHLFASENYACGLLNDHLAQLASEMPEIKAIPSASRVSSCFASMVARDADDSFAVRDLPVLLVYRGTALAETIVNVSHELDGEFTFDRVRAFIREHVCK